MIEDNPLQAARVEKWFKVNGDDTLRVNYPLNSNSVVFDVGGYKGEWANKIFNKYKCNIWIFEPVENFYNNIKVIFNNNTKVNVFQFGLSNVNQKSFINILDDKSSLFNDSEQKELIEIKSISEFIESNKIQRIDLLKLNIEGGEYDLIEELIDTNWIININDIQVQFHDFVPNATKRLIKLREKLEITHYLTYEYEFVWENWRKRD